MANIRTLKTKTLNQLALSNNFIYLLNTATNVESRLAVSSLVGDNITSTGTGFTIYAGLVSNHLNFKSLTSISSILSISDDNKTLSLGITESNINLASCINTTSLFLSAVDLTSNVGTTILPVANGGTGAATLIDGGILLGSGTGAITAMSALAAGSIIQGDGTTAPSVLSIGTAGKILTVNSGATALEWATPATADGLGNHTATTTLNMSNNNIDLGTGTINYTGVGTVGLTFDSANRAHIIPTGNTATGGTEALNLSGNIFLKGDASREFVVGAPTSGNGSEFLLKGSAAGTSSSDGGPLNFKPGSSTSGDGGNINLYAGSSTSGSAGDISLITRSGSSTTFPVLRVTNTKKVSIQNSTSNKTPLGLLDIHQTESSGAIPVLNLTQSDAAYAFAQFTGSTAADSSRNISSSTTIEAAKTGAIKVLVQNGDETATVAWIRLWESAI
jgi:hypothetical protein